MTMAQPNPNVLTIKIYGSPGEAVNWNRDHVDVRAIDISEAHIVLEGVESGLSTVDILVETQNGERFIGMLTSALIKQLAGVIEEAESRKRK